MDKNKQNEVLRLQKIMQGALNRKGAASRMREDIRRASDPSTKPEPVHYEPAPTIEEFRAKMAQLSAVWRAQHPGFAAQQDTPDETIVPFARPGGKEASLPPAAANGEDEFMYRLAAGAAGQEDDEKLAVLNVRLVVDGRSIALFADEYGSSGVYARRADLEPEWRGILVGKYRFRLKPSSTSAAYTLIDGLTLRTLRVAAPGDRHEPADIEAQPYE